MVRFDYLGDITLTVSARNSSGELIQAPTTIANPALVKPSHIWWGRLWHLDIPLEVLQEDCYIIVTMQSRSMQTGVLTGVLCYGVLKLSRTTISSGISVLNFASGQFNPNNINSLLSNPELHGNGAFLDVDLALIRRADLVPDINQLQQTPSSSRRASFLAAAFKRRASVNTATSTTPSTSASVSNAPNIAIAKPATPAAGVSEDANKGQTPISKSTVKFASDQSASSGSGGGADVRTIRRLFNDVESMDPNRGPVGGNVTRSEPGSHSWIRVVGLSMPPPLKEAEAATLVGEEGGALHRQLL